VLALGASHVAQNSDPSHTAQALKHRVAAMKLVKELLARPAKTLADGDALFGTLAILTCQSALIPDAMVEYMTLTRGANLVATAIMPDMNKSLFKDFAPERHTLILTRLVSEQPGDLDHIAGFRSSVRRLEPLCRTPSEVLYVGALLQIPDVLERSSSEGEEVCPMANSAAADTVHSVVTLLGLVLDPHALQQRRVGCFFSRGQPRWPAFAPAHVPPGLRARKLHDRPLPGAQVSRAKECGHLVGGKGRKSLASPFDVLRRVARLLLRCFVV